MRRFGIIMIIILLISVLTIAALKFIPNQGRSRVDFTRIPQEIQLNYTDAAYQFSFDEEDALAIMSNPSRYRREFNQLVYDLNLSILNHVANRMGLSPSLKDRIPEEYDPHHNYLRNMYYQDFLAIQDTTSTLYQTWYDNGYASVTEVMQQVASKYTCYLVNVVLTDLLPLEEGKLYAKGKGVDTPCGIAMMEALQPVMARLKQRAAIEDFSRSRGLMQERVEKTIAELATIEIQDKKGLNKQLQTRLWGFAVSSTDIEISAISIMKIGFRLDDYFNVDLNSRNRTIVVTLPEPVILSHEVYPKFDKLNIGWLREVKDVDLNESFNILREEFRREAYEGDDMNQAKARAQEVMETMFGPVVASVGKDYKLRVRFQNIAPDSGAFTPEDEFAEFQ